MNLSRNLSGSDKAGNRYLTGPGLLRMDASQSSGGNASPQKRGADSEKRSATWFFLFGAKLTETTVQGISSLVFMLVSRSRWSLATMLVSSSRQPLALMVMVCVISLKG